MAITTNFLDAVALAANQSPGPLVVPWPVSGNPGGFVSFANFAEWQAFVMNLGLRGRIPEIVTAKFERALKLHILAWIDFDLIKTGELVALASQHIPNLCDEPPGARRLCRRDLGVRVYRLFSLVCLYFKHGQATQSLPERRVWSDRHRIWSYRHRNCSRDHPGDDRRWHPSQIYLSNDIDRAEIGPPQLPGLISLEVKSSVVRQKRGPASAGPVEVGNERRRSTCARLRFC
jgi:hypothetical protein